MEELEKCCTRSIKESEDPEKKYLQLNRVEDFLLKPAIPFIRIGHLPRGRYFQLKGDLIMVSADVVETMNNILPREQNLLPVALKRKIEYSGDCLQDKKVHPLFLHHFHVQNTIGIFLQNKFIKQ